MVGGYVEDLLLIPVSMEDLSVDGWSVAGVRWVGWRPVGRSVVAGRWVVGETVGESMLGALSVVGGFVIRRLQKNSSTEQMIVINDVLNIRY